MYTCSNPYTHCSKSHLSHSKDTSADALTASQTTEKGQKLINIHKWFFVPTCPLLQNLSCAMKWVLGPQGSWSWKPGGFTWVFLLGCPFPVVSPSALMENNAVPAPPLTARELALFSGKDELAKGAECWSFNRFCCCFNRWVSSPCPFLALSQKTLTCILWGGWARSFNSFHWHYLWIMDYYSWLILLGHTHSSHCTRQ